MSESEKRILQCEEFETDAPVALDSESSLVDGELAKDLPNY